MMCIPRLAYHIVNPWINANTSKLAKYECDHVSPFWVCIWAAARRENYRSRREMSQMFNASCVACPDFLGNLLRVTVKHAFELPPEQGYWGATITTRAEYWLTEALKKQKPNKTETGFVVEKSGLFHLGRGQDATSQPTEAAAAAP